MSDPNVEFKSPVRFGAEIRTNRGYWQKAKTAFIPRRDSGLLEQSDELEPE
jgi:hypothetical protein